MFSPLTPYIAKDYFLWKEIKRQPELCYIKPSICANWQLTKPRALHSTPLATVEQSLVPHQGGVGHRPLVQKPEPRSHPRAAFSAARNWSHLTHCSLQPFPKSFCFPWGTVTDWDQLLTHMDAKAEMLQLTLNCFKIQHGYFISTKARSLPGIRTNQVCMTQHTLKNIPASVFCLALFLWDTKPVIHIPKAWKPL